jgi:hypothetical protein
VCGAGASPRMDACRPLKADSACPTLSSQHLRAGLFRFRRCATVGWFVPHVALNGEFRNTSYALGFILAPLRG